MSSAEKQMNWTSETVISKLYEASDSTGRVDKQRLELWAKVLRSRPGEEVFSSLMEVFSQSDRLKTRYIDQEYAGRLLLAVQPPCPSDVRDVIGRVLLVWGVSVEQLPLYFEEAIGRDALLRVLDELSVHPFSPKVKNAIDTFRFWLRTK
jgi:hypothetical protein